MELSTTAVAMTCTLQLTEREVRMLNHICSYGLGKGIYAKITRQFKAEDWDKLFSNIRSETDAVVRRMSETREVFQGTLLAKRERDYNHLVEELQRIRKELADLKAKTPV